MNLLTKQKQTHGLREQAYGFWGGKMRGKGYLGSLGCTYTHCYIQGPTV